MVVIKKRDLTIIMGKMEGLGKVTFALITRSNAIRPSSHRALFALTLRSNTLKSGECIGCANDALTSCSERVQNAFRTRSNCENMCSKSNGENIALGAP